MRTRIKGGLKMSKILEVKNIRKSYGKQLILDQIDLNINQLPALQEARAA